MSTTYPSQCVVFLKSFNAVLQGDKEVERKNLCNTTFFHI